MAGHCASTCPVEGGFYSYDPSIGGNVVLLAVFILLCPVTCFLGIRHRTPLFSAILTTGFLAEIVGFVGRLLLHKSRDNTGYFFLSIFGTVLGPILIAASIFLVLPHVLGIYGHHICPFRPLVAGLVLDGVAAVALVVELVGTILTAYESGGVDRRRGTKVVAAGLGIQTVTLLGSCALHFWFSLELGTRRGSLDAKHSRIYSSSKFKKFLMVLETATVLLLVNSVYRIVEFADGITGSSFQNQVAFMVLNGAFPAIVGILLTVFHPGLAFGPAWSDTTPRELKRKGRPPPIQHPTGLTAHHSYDPDIRKQISPAEYPLKGSKSPPGIPAGSPGLPSNPKPVSKPNSPRQPISPGKPSPATTQRGSFPTDRNRAQTASGLVDSDALW